MAKKRSFRAKPKKVKKKAPNPADMMGQFQKMQADMAAAQEELAEKTTSVTAGGGAIEIVISGHQRVQAITIEPELLDPEEVEMLQDMLVAAVNLAIEKSQSMSAERMEGLTSGMGINDLLGGLGM